MRAPVAQAVFCFSVLLLALPEASAQGSFGLPHQPSNTPPPFDHRHQPQQQGGAGGQYFPYEAAQQQQPQLQQGRVPTPPHLAQYGQQQQQPQHFPGQGKAYDAQKQGESIWQRIGQRLFQADGAQHQQQRRPPQYTGVPQGVSQQQRPTPSQPHRMGQQHRAPLPWQQGGEDGSLLSKGLKWLGLGEENLASQGRGLFGSPFPQHQHQQQPSGYPGYHQQQQQQHIPMQPHAAQGPYPPLPPMGGPSQTFQPQQQPGGAPSQQPFSHDGYSQGGNYAQPMQMQMQQPSMYGPQDVFMQPPQQQHFQQQQPPVPLIPEGPGTPEMFVVDDNVVFIQRPNDFYRKKQEFVRSGPQSVQVLANFEKTFTKFKTPNGQPALSTEALLETSGFLFPQAAAKIRQLRDEYAQQGFMDDASYEDLAAKIHQVIAGEGGMYIASIGPMVREQLASIPLREGWNDVLGKLAWGNIPLYMFSSGYGDVAAQVMGQHDPNAMGPNMRLISNLFRLTPDGSVRGFTMTVVHERNKNATTAARLMELPLTHRPNVLVLGTDEQDLSMSSGTAVNEQISVAYLDLTEDLPAKLPRYLEMFDVVILGDGSMNFISQLINELVGGPQ